MQYKNGGPSYIKGWMEMSIKMKDLPISERPYEKLQIYGEQKLSNAELLAIIIKNGTKDESSITLAQKILNLRGDTNNLNFLQEVSIEEFMSLKGIGIVKAVQLKALAELLKRMGTPINSKKIKISNSQDVANLFMQELRYEKCEHAKAILLNSKNIVIKIVNISLGGNNFANVEPKEFLAEAVRCSAPNIILVHNHPSGDPTPSGTDYIITDRLAECSDIMGIKLLDHVVIGNGIFKSAMLKTNDREYDK